MIRSLLIVLVVAFTLVGVGNAFAQCRDIQGQTQGVVLPGNPCGSILPENGCLQGSTISNFPADVVVKITSATPHPILPDVFFFGGETTISGPGVAVIFGVDSAATDIVGGRSADLLTITGGTGIFTGASGDVVLDTQFDFPNATFMAEFKGTICTP